METNDLQWFGYSSFDVTIVSPLFIASKTWSCICMNDHSSIPHEMLTSQHLIDIDIKISLNDLHTSKSYLDCFNKSISTYPAALKGLGKPFDAALQKKLPHPSPIPRPWLP